MDNESLNKVVELIKEVDPKFKLQWKKDSKFHKFIDWFMRSFGLSQHYMIRTWTTLGSTVSRPSMAENFKDEWEILLHELIHIRQSKRLSILQGILYMMPQALILLSPLLILAKWWAVFFGLLFLLPLPSYFRMLFEFEGYTINLITDFISHGELEASKNIPFYVNHFTGSTYYFMWPFKKSMTRKFDQKLQDIKSGKIYEKDNLLIKIRDLCVNIKEGKMR